MKFGHLCIMAALLCACGGSSSDDASAAESSGAEVATDTNEETSASDQAALQMREDAEHEARCGEVALIPGLPPSPPLPPAIPTYDRLGVIYEAALVPGPPADPEAAVRWGQDLGAKLSLLNQGVLALPESDQGIGLVWLAHALARLPELMKNQPVPGDMTDADEQREYRRGFYRASRPQVMSVLEQAIAVLDAAPVQGAWAEYRTALQTWIVQESCDRGFSMVR